MATAVVLAAMLQLLFAATANAATLKLLHAIWRHGSKTPWGVLPNDPGNTVASWSYGLGQITALGMRQQFRLGEYIKIRYRNVLSDQYSPFELNVVGQEVNLTLMSAQANCAGLYPPNNSLHWNETWTDHVKPAWFPVPIHSTSGDWDPMLNPYISCPKVDALMSDLMRSPQALKIMSDHALTFAFLREKTGLALADLNSICYVYEIIDIERINSKTHSWPVWMNETLFEQITSIYKLSLNFIAPTAALQRLRGGLLFGDIVERMNARANGTLDRRFKYQAYSTFHDPVAVLLINFRAYNALIIPYASAVFIELHEVGSQHFVELYFYNDTTKAPYPLSIRGCGFRCPLSFLRRLAEEKTPADWYGDCGFQTLASANAKIERLECEKTGLVISLVCFILISVLLSLTMLGRSVLGKRAGYKSIDK